MFDSKNGIVGLAIGDAMGVPLEFCTREELQKSPTTEMTGYGSHDVPKGCWSDDTSMTLATVDAIIKDKDVNCDTIANNFLAWLNDAKYTSTNKVFDIGRTCMKAIFRYAKGEEKAEECGGKSALNNGNGSLMRILPIVYYSYSNKMSEENIYNLVKRVSSITHAHEISIMGCFIYVIYGIELLNNKNLEQAYNIIKKINFNNYFSNETIEKYSRILKHNIKNYSMEEIKSTGFVIDTLEATLWVLLNTSTYDESIIKAINLGEDTDTVGACVGGIAGIYYGLDSINQSWKNDLLKYDYLVGLCDKFNEVLN